MYTKTQKYMLLLSHLHNIYRNFSDHKKSVLNFNGNIHVEVTKEINVTGLST